MLTHKLYVFLDLQKYCDKKRIIEIWSTFFARVASFGYRNFLRYIFFNDQKYEFGLNLWQIQRPHQVTLAKNLRPHFNGQFSNEVKRG